MLAFTDIKDILDQVDQWRSDAATIVFTNGCFDLLHLGHIAYLEEAAALGDYLVVGVNSDRSVKQLKGPTRPIKDEETRLKIVAALQPVAAAILFDQDTPLQLIQQLSPDVLVKGGDYRVEDIVGYDEVINSGGTVKQLSFLPGHSSSAIIDKIISF